MQQKHDLFYLLSRIAAATNCLEFLKADFNAID